MGILRLSETLDTLRKNLGMQTVESIPQRVIDSIQPVIVANHNPVIDIIQAIEAAGNIYTTPTDRDFYLCGYNISNFSTSVSAAVKDSITVTLPSGAIKILCSLRNGSGAASENVNSQALDFKTPILLKRGTNIVVSKTSSSLSCSIYGYLKDVE